MHFALGNTYRGVIAGWATAVLLALASAFNDDVSWKKTIGAIILISAPVAGALIDPGSKPAKEDQPK